MSSALDPSLQSRLRTLARRAPHERIACIVTLAPGHAPADVLPFAPTIEVALIRMAAGTMTAAQALALAGDARVERIELDGEAHALAPRNEEEDEPND